jgi:hypothetical protein
VYVPGSRLLLKDRKLGGFGVADGRKKRLGSGAWRMVIVIVGVDVFFAPNVASKEYKGILRHLVELVRGAA